MIKVIVALLAFALLIYLLAGPLARAEKAMKLRNIRDRFGSRELLAPEEFFDRYFSEPAYRREIVVGVRETLEKILDSDLAFLRDSDDFS